jgi:hypothetical protein
VRPDLEEVREALAGLLAHRPERGSDAVRQHASLLSEDPTRTGSLRALARLAGALDPEKRRDGLAILCALGVATASERGEAPERLRQSAAETSPADPVAAALRAAAHEAGSALCESLGVGVETELDQALARAEIGVLRRALVALAQVALEAPADPEAPAEDAAAREALEGRLGRWSRRKVRRALAGATARQIAALDFEAWRRALRVDRAARALEAHGDLRAALVATLRSWAAADWADDPAGAGADLTARVRACPEARALLARVVGSWIREL